MLETTYKWSIKEYHKLIDDGYFDGKKVELLAGEIIQMSPEGNEHYYTNDYLHQYLVKKFVDRAYVSKTPPLAIKRIKPEGKDSEPEPDIVLLKPPIESYKGRKPAAKDVYLLIEVSKSTLKKDLTEKAGIYAYNLIPEYWVVDLVNNKLIVHRNPKESKYQSVTEVSEGAIACEAFPKIDLDLAKVLLFP